MSRIEVRPLSFAAGAGLLACIAGAPYWKDHPLFAAVAILMSASLAAVGSMYTATVAGRRMGWFFVAAACLNAISWASAYNRSVLPLLGEFTQGIFFLCLGVGCLLFGQATLGGWAERAWTVQAFLTLIVGQIVITVTSTPADYGYSIESRWVTLIPVSEATLQGLLETQSVLYLLLAITFSLALAWRWKRLGGLDRRIAVPVLVTSGSMALFSAVVQSRVMTVGSSLDSVMEVRVLQGSAAVSVPLALFASNAWRRWRELTIAARLISMVNPPTIDNVERALRVTLRDDRLRIWVWLPPRQCFIDNQGLLWPADRLRELQMAGHWRHIESTDDGLLAYCITRQSAVVEDGITNAALLAASQPLRAAQLQAMSDERLRELQERIVAAEEAGRREVARDLHDGVQQRLLALSMDLNRASRMSPSTEMRNAVVEACQRVDEIIQELRRTSRGVHPPMLTELGLSAALEKAAERLGTRISLTVEVRRLHPMTEVALYYALTEALTNAHKHAQATQVDVRIWSSDGEVIGEVHDNGVGGAALRLGGGLNGAEDRVRALRGCLELLSPPGLGTTVRVHLPALELGT